VSVRGTKAAAWDEATWGPLEYLAAHQPEAGVHFQGKDLLQNAFMDRIVLTSTTECQIHSRSKDVGSATASWFAELLSPDPWFKAVVPNVIHYHDPDQHL